MKATHCHAIRVKDESGRQVLHWTEPWFGSLTVKNDGDRVIIERKGLLGRKTYMPSMNESVEISDSIFKFP